MTPRTRRVASDPTQSDSQILDLHFMKKAIERFPTARSAIDGLRAIGKPQKGLLKDSLYPAGEVETFLAMAGSLAVCMRGRTRQEQQVAVLLTRNNWTSLIAPWIMLTIEELILPDLESETPYTSNTRELAMWIIPYLLYPPKLHARIDFSLRELRDETPELAILLSRVWVKVIDQHHRTWGPWANLLASIVRGDLVQGPTHSTTYEIFKSLHPLGHIILRHINDETPRIPTMNNDELVGFNNFILLANSDQYGGSGPLNAEGVEKNSLPALIRLASGLLYKRKILREPGLNSEREASIVTLVLNNILKMMDGSVRVSEAIESGIMVALIRAFPCYFERDDPRLPQFEEHALKLLDRVSMYLVYPSVLHQFLRSSKKIMRLKEIQKQLRSKSKVLWGAWERTRKKAAKFHNIRQELIEDGRFWKCSNASVRTISRLFTFRLQLKRG
ncbi:hypothetical protein L218DRAFT_739665 [Marasmius fiardii PR-910]|nr:hypothetical protein L218DRAFT_739665 [Marasmius fiardii PR-910]